MKRKGETNNNVYDAHLTGQNIYIPYRLIDFECNYRSIITIY